MAHDGQTSGLQDCHDRVKDRQPQPQPPGGLRGCPGEPSLKEDGFPVDGGDDAVRVDEPVGDDVGGNFLYKKMIQLGGGRGADCSMAKWIAFRPNRPELDSRRFQF